MRVRFLGALLGAALAASTLAGCKTNVGTAATVGGSRITESDVNSYIVAGSKASSGSTPVPAKSIVLETLVQERLVERTLADNGGVPSDGVLAGVKNEAAETLLGTTASNATASLTTGLRQSGIKTSFAPHFIRVAELQYMLAQRKNLARFGDTTATDTRSITDTLTRSGVNADPSAVAAVAKALSAELARAKLGALSEIVTRGLNAALASVGVRASASILQALVPPLVEALRNEQFPGASKLVRDSHISVSVNPRYGTWDAATLTLKFDDNAGTPDFLRIRTPAAAATPTGG